MSSRRRWLLFASFQLFLALCASQGCDPFPLQEGHQGTLACSAPVTTRQLSWQLEQGGSFVNLSSCVAYGPCNNFLQNFSASNQISSDNTTYTSVLIIGSANRNQTIFKCVADGGAGEIVCKIDIYVKPTTPTCSSPVVYSSSEIALSCNTSRVYPEAVCLFFYLNQINQSFNGRVEYQHFSSPTNPGDKATVCTVIMEVTGFKPGNYQLMLKMFPQLAKVPAIAVVDINTVPTISLRAPTVTIGKDCPSGPSINDSYIDARFSESTTCRCDLADEGFPRGQALWYNNSGSVTGIKNTVDGSSNVTLNYNSIDPNPTYECAASTVLNTTAASITYRPRYAAGPNTVSISVANEIFDLCPSTNGNITITCTVPTLQVSPAPTFSIFINSQNHVLKQVGRLTSTEYTYNYSFRPESGGNLQVICRAENSVFFEVQAERRTTIQVREPPKSEPAMSVLYRGTDISQKNVSVADGDSISVNCVVDGGTPLVQSVTVNCGNPSKRDTGNRATLVLSASASLTGQICHCQASHVSNCYNKVAETVLTFQIFHKEKDTKSDNLGMKIGLPVGLGALVVILIIIVVIVLCRRRSRGTSRPPTYVSDWINDKNNHHDTSFSATLPGQSRHATLPPYAAPESPYSSIYDEIPPKFEDYSSFHANRNTAAPSRHRNDEIPLPPPDYIGFPANRNTTPNAHKNAGYSDYIQPN